MASVSWTIEVPIPHTFDHLVANVLHRTVEVEGAWITRRRHAAEGLVVERQRQILVLGARDGCSVTNLRMIEHGMNRVQQIIKMGMREFAEKHAGRHKLSNGTSRVDRLLGTVRILRQIHRLDSRACEGHLAERKVR